MTTDDEIDVLLDRLMEPGYGTVTKEEETFDCGCVFMVTFIQSPTSSGINREIITPCKQHNYEE